MITFGREYVKYKLAAVVAAEFIEVSSALSNSSPLFFGLLTRKHTELACERLRRKCCGA